MPTSFRIYAHIDLVDELGEKDGEGRHINPSFVKFSEVTNCVSGRSLKYWKAMEVVCLLADVQIYSDGSRDWIYHALGVNGHCGLTYIDPGDMREFEELVRSVCDNEVSDLRDFCQRLEGHPDVECDDDEDGQLFADVTQTCLAIRDQWDTEMSLRASYFRVETC